MVRNPFLKDDSGCHFIMILFLFGLVQYIYYSTFIKIAFVTDHGIEFHDLEVKRGNRNATDCPLVFSNQEFIKTDNFWVPALLFYFFAIMVVLSFRKFIFTDIAYKEMPKSRDQYGINLTSVHLCIKCKTLRGYFFRVSNNLPYIFIKR